MNTIATSVVMAAAILMVGAAQANALPAHPEQSPAASVHIEPSFCPLGKAHKHGKGCRGGSINDSRTVEDLRESAKVAGKCTAKALGKGMYDKLRKRKPPKKGDLPLTPSPGMTAARIFGCTVLTPEPAR